MNKDVLRMMDWLLWALVCYVIVIVLRMLNVEPQIQTVLWKLGNLTVAAYAGYWIDRRAFRTRMEFATDLEQLRRAIVMAAAMLAVGLGL